MNRKYADMLGYTQEEVVRYFAEYLNELAADEEVDMETLLARIRQWYNGYQFSVKPIFEFKLYDSAEAALEQIRTREYFQKYQNSDKQLVLVGVGFELEIRNIGKWLVEKRA